MLPSRKMVNDKLLRCHNIEGPDSKTREKNGKKKVNHTIRFVETRDKSCLGLSE